MLYIDKMPADTSYTLYNKAFAPRFSASRLLDISPYKIDIAYYQINGYTRYEKSPLIGLTFYIPRAYKTLFNE
jgi:hypothetical protein